MAEKAVLRFRGLLASLGRKLTPEEAKSLALIYLGEENISDVNSGTDVMDRISKRGKLRNCKDDLTQLKESLDSSGRSDLTTDVDEYLTQNPLLPEHSEPVASTTAGLHLGTEEKESDLSKSTVTGIVAGKRTDPGNCLTSGNVTKKRRRNETEEERDLEEATGDMTCDSTSDSSDDADMGTDGSDNGETTEDDRKFMAQARECAKRSKDEQTKVGAVLVDPNGTIIGEGWNRMPRSCEDFTWVSADNKPLQEGKHLYVVYAIRAAIFDAYQKGHNPAHSVLYTTLYPSNVCAQCIREARIDEVVYVSDKFHKTKFMKASRKIMAGIKCRLFNDQDSDSLKLNYVLAVIPTPVVPTATTSVAATPMVASSS